MNGRLKMVRPMLSNRCPVCLPVRLMHCGQMVGRIKMKHGMEVGLGTGHIVLAGEPALPKWAQSPNFRPMSIVANGRSSQLLLSSYTTQQAIIHTDSDDLSGLQR